MSESIRLTCKYEGEKVIIQKQERVEMLSPASDDDINFDNVVGFWLELRDNKGKPLYRQVMQDPFRSDIEIFGDPKSEEETISRSPVKNVKGHLVVTVPALPTANSIAFVRASPDEQTNKLAVKDVAELLLNENVRGSVINSGKEDRNRGESNGQI
jgi:hypothetical protein